MASRGRRSCGDGVGLNPAMIYLLDLARLRKELQSRGLDTKGNKQTLADRLEEAIRLGKSADSEKSAEQSPTKSTPTKRTASKTSQQNNLKMEIDSSSQINTLDESADKISKNGISTRKRKLPDDEKKASTPKFVKFVWATEAPVEAIEKVEPSVVTESIPNAADDNYENLNIPTSAKKSKTKSKTKLAKEDFGITTRAKAATTSSTDLSLSPAATNVDVYTIAASTASSLVDTLISSISEEVKESKMECMPPEADFIASESAAAKSVVTTSILSSTDSMPATTVANVNSPPASTKPTTSKFDSSKTPSTSVKVAITASLSIVTPTTMTTVVPSTPATSPMNITPISAKSSLQKSTPTFAKTPQLPKRVIAGNVDLFDNILSQQNQLLADKYKSEQEKAMEKRLFELQKRRFSAAGTRVSGISAAEKRPLRSAEGGSSQSTISPTLGNDYLLTVVGFNNRDPLNLRDLKPLGTEISNTSLERNERDMSLGSHVSSSTTREISVSRRNTSDGFIPHEKPANAVKLPQGEFLLPPPPPPPACLVPPPPPKPHPKFPITNSKTDIVIPPPPPRLPKSQSAAASTSRVEPSSVMVVPPPPPPRLPKPHLTDSADIKTAELFIPPPPPPRFPKSQVSNVSKECESVVVVPPPPPRVKSPATDLDASNSAQVNSISPPPIVDATESPTSLAPAPVEGSAEGKNEPSTIVEVFVTFENVSVNAATASENAPIKVLTAVTSASISPSKSPASVESDITFSDMKFQTKTISTATNIPSSIDTALSVAPMSMEPISIIMTQSALTELDTFTATEVMVPSTPTSVMNTVNIALEATIQSEHFDVNVLENSPLQAEQLIEIDHSNREKSIEKSSNENENITSSIEGNNTAVKIEPEDSEHDISALLLKDPKALLRRATDVLKRINESENIGSEDLSTSRYDQLELDTSDYIMEEEEKPLPDFHGEPVPDDEDDDDALFEIAAGLRPANKKRDSVPTAAEDEPLPDDEFIELDYYNADMNIKAATNNKWLIDPDNQDGFALMWGGVKSNYGILVSDDFHAPSSSTERLATRRNFAGSTDDDDDEDVIEFMNIVNSDDEHARPSCSQTTLASASYAPKLLPKRVAFGIKVVEFLSLKHVPFEELEPHDVRIGWSVAGTSNMLGESNQSYMYCSNARKANANIFTDYGDPFHVNDVVTTVLDFEKHEIRYYKNKEKMGVAFSSVDFPVGTVVFPHIATKNCKVFVNFGYDDLPETENADDWSLPDDEISNEEEELVRMNNEDEYDGAVMIGLLQRRSGLLVPSRRPPPDKTHCTVISMVGLPGAGKSTWVKQYLFDHPDEHWILFNTDTILNAMTVNGISRRRVHQSRWDMVMGLTAKALNRSLQMACRRRHNYIIDQTNVSREARKRKLTQFADFQRKCVVILPPDDELERRLLRQSRQEGSAGPIPAEAMLELKGVMSIPCTETEPIEDVFFVEPPMERLNEAIEQVKKYNEEGRPWIRKQHPTQKPESIISDCRNDNSNLWMTNQQPSQNQRSSHNSTF